MVRTDYFNEGDQRLDKFVGQVILRPNYSTGWRATAVFVATLMVLSLAIATVFTLRGMWLVLPFTILEMSLLSGCLYWVARRNYAQQVLRFSADEVVVEVGRKNPQSRRVMERFFTKILVEQPSHPWYPMKISLRCRDEKLEVGEFLTSADKKILVSDLRDLVRAADRSHVSKINLDV